MLGQRNQGYEPKLSDKQFHKSSISELSRKHKIRSSIRSKNSVTPEYGANPRYSKDVEKKAVEKYQNSKKYKNIDIEKSLKDVDDGIKKKILTKRIKEGKSVPKNISDKFVEKEHINLVKNDSGLKDNWYRAFDKNDKRYEVLVELYDIMVKTNDYSEYKRAHDKIAKMTGYPSNVSFENFMVRDKYRSITFGVIRDGVKDNITKTDTLYHGSKNPDIKQLTPTFKSKDGVFYGSPRIYFNKNSQGSRIGRKSTKSNDSQYTPDKGLLKSKIDNELGGNTRYITTTRELDVKKVN